MLRKWWILTGIAITAGIFWVLTQQDFERREYSRSAAAAQAKETLHALEGPVERWRAAAGGERLAYAQYFLGLVDERRAQLMTRLDVAAEERDESVSSTLAHVLAILLFCSLAFLLVPVFVGRKYPGRRRRLWVYTVVGFVLLVLSLLLFFGLLTMLREISAIASRGINPERGIVEAGFDLLEGRARSMVATQDEDGGALPLGPVVGSLADDPSGGFAANLLRNLRYFDMDAFETAATWMSHGYRLLRFLPHIIPYLLLVLFFFTLRSVLKEILSMPARAASGERRVARRAVGVVMSTLGKEFLSLLVLFGFVLLLTMLVQLSVHAFTRGIVEWTLLHAESTVHYLGLLSGPPDRAGLFAGLMSVPFCLAITVLCIALGVTGSTFWARRVTQLRFHEGVKLGAHHGFWRKALMSVLRLSWIPVLTLWILFPLARAMARDPAPSNADDALAVLWKLAIISIGSLCAALVLFGGLRAALYFARFRPTRPECDAPEPEVRTTS